MRTYDPEFLCTDRIFCDTFCVFLYFDIPSYPSDICQGNLFFPEFPWLLNLDSIAPDSDFLFFLVLWHLVFFGNSTHAYRLTLLYTALPFWSHTRLPTQSHTHPHSPYSDISSRGLPWVQVIHSMFLPRCFKPMCSTTNSVLPWDLAHSSSTFPWLGGTIAWDESSEFSLIFTTRTRPPEQARFIYFDFTPWPFH